MQYSSDSVTACACDLFHTVRSAEAGESSQSDSHQPSVLSGDSRHCSDVESKVSDSSSDNSPEECPSPAQKPTSLPVTSKGSSAFRWI